MTRSWIDHAVYPPPSLQLFHYTCTDHGQPGIERDGFLRPSKHPWLPEPLVWLTDLDVPVRDALGLTSHTLSCDRTAIRYAVLNEAAELAQPWSVYAKTLLHLTRDDFEMQPGSMPAHWWVSRIPLAVTRPVSP